MTHRTIPAATLAVLLVLPSCRSHSSATTGRRDTTTHYTDTTRTTADTLRHRLTVITADTACTSADGILLVEFTDSGGTAHIDSAGRLTLRGVKTLRARGHTRTSQSHAASLAEKTAAARTIRHGGTTADVRQQTTRTRQTQKTPAWPHAIAITIPLCALLWLLRRPLQRKLRQKPGK